MLRKIVLFITTMFITLLFSVTVQARTPDVYITTPVDDTTLFAVYDAFDCYPKGLLNTLGNEGFVVILTDIPMFNVKGETIEGNFDTSSRAIYVSSTVTDYTQVQHIVLHELYHAYLCLNPFFDATTIMRQCDKHFKELSTVKDLPATADEYAAECFAYYYTDTEKLQREDPWMYNYVTSHTKLLMKLNN